MTTTTLILFFWLTYNLPPFILGFKQWSSIKKQRAKDLNTYDPPDPPTDFQPKVSIIVPAKNEDNVIERLLQKLVNLTYQNKEIILIEDGSTDRTPQICRQWMEKYPTLIKYYHSNESIGKPLAINYGASKATGEIIAVYDADTIVEQDILQQIIPHFKDPKVAAVQGELETLNPDENLVTKLTALSDFFVNIQQLGKDRLNLLVLLSGTNQYIRRHVLEEIGYWDKDALSEDVEISVRLARKGYKIKYVPVKAEGEAPAKLKIFLQQRAKWLRGHTQAAVKHRGLLSTLNWKMFDAQVTLLFPIMLIIGLIGYILSLYGAVNYGVAQSMGAPIVQIIGTVLLFLNLLTLAFIAASKPKNAIYVPLLYVDWILFAVISVYVHIRALLRKPQKWTRTPKSGNITIHTTNVQCRSVDF
jgi:cellulose synthase/poly-beta-1,6-N-acetylglucosamine synthase-like glycosyltransferase